MYELTENYIPSAHLHPLHEGQEDCISCRFIKCALRCYFATSIEEKIQGRASWCECINDRPNTNIVNPIPGRTATTLQYKLTNLFGEELLFWKFHCCYCRCRGILGELWGNWWQHILLPYLSLCTKNTKRAGDTYFCTRRQPSKLQFSTAARSAAPLNSIHKCECYGRAEELKCSGVCVWRALHIYT